MTCHYSLGTCFLNKREVGICAQVYALFAKIGLYIPKLIFHALPSEVQCKPFVKPHSNNVQLCNCSSCMTDKICTQAASAQRIQS